MRIQTRHVRWALFLCAPLFLAACSDCSPTNAVGSVLISDADEEELGTEFNKQLLAKSDSFPIFNPGTDTAKMLLESYLDSVFLTVFDAVPAEDVPNYNFKFTIIDQDVANAFAVPGGYVYLYTGILKEMKSESELAGVLAHEIAHVTLHHYRKSAVKAYGAGMILQAIAGKEAGALTQFVLGSMGFFAGQYISRDHEDEADAKGTWYLAWSRRNAHGIADFFRRMHTSRLDPVLEPFSTHPISADRVERVEALVADHQTLRAYDSTAYRYADKFLARTAVVGGGTTAP